MSLRDDAIRIWADAERNPTSCFPAAVSVHWSACAKAPAGDTAHTRWDAPPLCFTLYTLYLQKKRTFWQSLASGGVSWCRGVSDCSGKAAWVGVHSGVFPPHSRAMMERDAEGWVKMAGVSSRDTFIISALIFNLLTLLIKLIHTGSMSQSSVIFVFTLTTFTSVLILFPELQWDISHDKCVFLR